MFYCCLRGEIKIYIRVVLLLNRLRIFSIQMVEYRWSRKKRQASRGKKIHCNITEVFFMQTTINKWTNFSAFSWMVKTTFPCLCTLKDHYIVRPVTCLFRSVHKGLFFLQFWTFHRFGDRKCLEVQGCSFGTSLWIVPEAHSLWHVTKFEHMLITKCHFCLFLIN